MGQIFQPGGFSGLDPLIVHGSNIGQTINNTTSVCAANLVDRACSWASVSNAVNTGQINGSVAGAIILFLVEIQMTVLPASFTDIRIDANPSGGANALTNEISPKRAFNPITNTSHIFQQWFVWQFNASSSNSVFFTYRIEGTVGTDNATTFSQLKGFRVL